EKTINWFKENHIKYSSIKSYSTPRRLAIRIQDIALHQETITNEVRVPQAKIAKTERANWTKAAIGFTKGQRMSTEDIYIKEEKGLAYVYVEKKVEGKETSAILPEFKEIISSLSFPQTMRWGSDSYRFARPI